mgnify:CR=1 FL=1
MYGEAPGRVPYPVPGLGGLGPAAAVRGCAAAVLDRERGRDRGDPADARALGGPPRDGGGEVGDDGVRALAINHGLQLRERFGKDREVLPELGHQTQRAVPDGFVGVADALQDRGVVGQQRVDGEVEAMQEGYGAGGGREPYVVALVAEPLGDGDQGVEVARERWRGDEEAAHQGSWAAWMTRSATSGSRA